MRGGGGGHLRTQKRTAAREISRPVKNVLIPRHGSEEGILALAESCVKKPTPFYGLKRERPGRLICRENFF